MAKTSLPLTARQMCLLMSESMAHYAPETLAYIFATSKSELFARDALAIRMMETLKLKQNQYVGREWRRHDLGIIEDMKPLAIIEGKANMYFNVLNPTRFQSGQRNMKKSLEEDLFKAQKTIKELTGKKTGAQAIITNILCGIEVTDSYNKDLGIIGYSKGHLRDIANHGSLEQILNLARPRMKKLHSQYGNSSSVNLVESYFMGMRVVVDFYALIAK